MEDLTPQPEQNIPVPDFLGDPRPFGIDDYFSEWSKLGPMEEVPDNRASFVKVAHNLSRPFLAQGYNSAAALNRGLAGFSAHLDAISDFVSISTGMEKGGIFENAAKRYEDNAEYWKQRAEKVGIGFVDEIVSEAVGGFVPGVSQFVMDVASSFTFPYMDGAAQAYKRGEDPFSAGMLEAAKTGTLAGIFRMIHPLKQYLRAPIMGTVFGIEEAETTPEGQKVKAFVKGAAIGAGYSMTSPGGRMGLNEVGEAMKPAINKFITDMKSERGAIGIEKPPAKTLKQAYDTVRERLKGMPHVPISEVMKEMGITDLNEIKPLILQGFKNGSIQGSGASWTLGEAHPFLTPEMKAATFYLGNQRISDIKVLRESAEKVEPAPAQEVTQPTGYIPPDVIEAGQKRPRKFLKRVEESLDMEPELKKQLEKVDPQDYLVQPNAESLAKAGEKIKTEGLDKTVDYALSDAPLSAEKGATFITLMERFQKEGDFDRAVQMIEAYDMQLREAGRFVQAASLFSRGSPQVFIRWANKQLKAVESKYGWADTILGRKPESFSLSKDEQKLIMDKYREINELPAGADKIDATLRLIDVVAKKVPPSVSELIDAYRYQNMLSSIRTQMRNVGENVFNTFISKPVDITTRGGIDYFKSLLTGKDREAYVKDVAVYMKTAINAVPNAVHAFTETLKLSRTADIGKPEVGIEAKGEFGRARAKQIPTALTLVSRFMEAADKFNMALIGAGEMAVQKKRGLSDADAYRKATKTAEEYLYRGKLDPTDPRLSYPSQLLASLGKMMEGSRKLPGLGTLSKWYVPFLKTPINKGIQMVERSPIGALRDPKQLADAEIQAKLLSGAIVTALGAIATMQGQTTWAPPSDTKEKALFYASGRKPFSVKMGDKWIPLWYLGPFALAFGIPMAIKHYTVDRKQALTGDATDRIIEIANGLSQFIGSQSSTQSIGALFSALSGDINFTFPQQTGFTVQQIIPATSLIRYINTIVDPVYRKPQGFVEHIEANLPFLSQKLDARMTPLFEESKRETINYFLPYDVGTSQELYESLLPLERYNARQRYLEGRVNDVTKRLRGNEITPEESMKEIMKIMQVTPKSLEMLGEELNK